MKLLSSRAFRKSLVVIYWIALPLCLLVFVASFATFNSTGGYAPSWRMMAGSAALAALIGWRLRLNARALRLVGDMPPPRRLLRVFLPLALLSFVGLAVILLGIAWTGLGLWMAFQPGALDSRLFYPGGMIDGRLSGFLLASLGLLTLVVGLALNLPLLRILNRKPAETPSPAEPAVLDTAHD